MSAKLSEISQGVMGLAPQALNNTNATGRYHALAKYGRMIFRALVTTMAATKTAILSLYEASDAAGTGAQAITGATATVTANTSVIKATADVTSVGTGDILTVNGISFTKAASTAAASREFANAAGVVTCVNDATYGVPGVTASASGEVVTFLATDPGEKLITLAKTETAGTITLATVEAMVEVEVNASALSAGFTHVAAKLAVTSNSTVTVFGERYEARHTPLNNAGAVAAV